MIYNPIDSRLYALSYNSSMQNVNRKRDVLMVIDPSLTGVARYVHFSYAFAPVSGNGSYF